MALPDLDFMFHMFFLARYCKLLEENSFRGRTADFFYMLLFGATVLTGIVLVGGMIPYLSESFAKIIFLSNSLTFMMVSCPFFIYLFEHKYFFLHWLQLFLKCYYIFYLTGLCVEQAKSFYSYEFLGTFYFHGSLLTMGEWDSKPFCIALWNHYVTESALNPALILCVFSFQLVLLLILIWDARRFGPIIWSIRHSLYLIHSRSCRFFWDSLSLLEPVLGLTCWYVFAFIWDISIASCSYSDIPC